MADKEKPVSFKGMASKELKDWTRQELLGMIIEKSVELEFWIDQRIMHFFKPDNRDIFKKVVLNPGVVSFYGKTKILQNIGVDKKAIEKARQANNIRNAFAHNKIFNFDYDKFKQEKFVWDMPESIIYTMKTNGELETKSVLNMSGVTSRRLKRQLMAFILIQKILTHKTKTHRMGEL